MLNMLVRYSFFALCIVLSITPAFIAGVPLWVSFPFIILSLIGCRDILQTKQTVRCNYPILGNLRYLLESIRPEMRQYFFEGDQDALPFSRSARAMVYRRARNIPANKSFGTLDDVYGKGHEYVAHSMNPVDVDMKTLKFVIGGPQCRSPYRANRLNISAMSFGALSANAIRALGEGARIGGFALNTGEGGISQHHLASGAHLIYQIGSGYFGCRNEAGQFDPDLFTDQAGRDQVRMIEIKLSQGAKPGHGGMLPGAKVSQEIAHARGVSPGVDCISPMAHSAFGNPGELIQFIARLRKLSGYKPIGIKMCVGSNLEAAKLVRAMVDAQTFPDYIVIDGSEGGTGAAPEEFSNHIGMPVRDGLVLMHNLLVGAGIRDDIKLGCSGKVISGFDVIRLLALGADWVNSARGFMFALGCIQSQSCGSDKCPTGIATQDKYRQRSLDVSDKAQKVANFQVNTLRSVAEILGAAGIHDINNLSPEDIMRRVVDGQIMAYSDIYEFIAPGSLIDASCTGKYLTLWNKAAPDKQQSKAA